MQTIDKREYQKRLDQISTLFGRMMEHADVLSAERCLYKDRLNQCTARFGCRNQRQAPVGGDPPLCEGDDKLDYRDAWDVTTPRR